MCRYWLVLFLLAFAASCRQVPPYEASQIDVIDTVHKTLDQYFANIEKDGINAEFNYLDASPNFFWVPPGAKQPLAYDTIVSMMKTNAARIRKMENRWDSLKIVPLNNDLASYAGRFHSIITDSGGRQSIQYFMETGIVIHRENGWKILNGQTTVLSQ